MIWLGGGGFQIGLAVSRFTPVPQLKLRWKQLRPEVLADASPVGLFIKHALYIRLDTQMLFDRLSANLLPQEMVHHTYICKKLFKAPPGWYQLSQWLIHPFSHVLLISLQTSIALKICLICKQIEINWSGDPHDFTIFLPSLLYLILNKIIYNNFKRTLLTSEFMITIFIIFGLRDDIRQRDFFNFKNPLIVHE